MGDKILQSFFDDKLDSAICNQKLHIPVYIKDYLSNLLIKIANDRYDLSVCIADLYIEYYQSQSLDRRIELLQQIGDTTLALCGYFPKYLIHRQVGIKYYIESGYTAYNNLSNLKQNEMLFSRLSSQYHDCMSLLNEVSTHNDIKSIDDMETIHSIWLQTNSKALRAILIKHGMLCIKVNS